MFEPGDFALLDEMRYVRIIHSPITGLPHAEREVYVEVEENPRLTYYVLAERLTSIKEQ